MTNGTTQRITVESSPPGASVFVDGNHAGETPVDVVVSRRDAALRVEIEKDGFLSSQHEIRRRPSWWLLLNAPTGWFAGGAFLGITDGLEKGGAWTRGAFAVMATPVAIDLATGGAFAFPPRVRSDLVSAGGRLKEPELPEHVMADLRLRETERRPPMRGAPASAPTHDASADSRTRDASG